MSDASTTSPRYRVGDLISFAAALLRQMRLPPPRARAVAEILVEADLLGHTTHGLDMLAPYLRELDAGHMRRDGDIDVVRDGGGVLTWDARLLPGPWVVREAIAAARARVAAHGTVTIAIARSHHIGCLQAYLQPVTQAGYVLLLMTSDPSGRGVTPHGGVASRLTPNPIAVGFPTGGDPVLIDVSMSTSTNAMTKRMYEAGRRLPGPWLVDAQGTAGDDPAVLHADPPGALLPLGGLDLGHKGFGLALMVEVLTSALAGRGRAEQPTRWGASVFLLLIDPAAFGGREAFLRETAWLAQLCRTTPVAPGAPPVRLPGERALARKRDGLAHGVSLYPGIMPALAPWAERLLVAVPSAV